MMTEDGKKPATKPATVHVTQAHTAISIVSFIPISSYTSIYVVEWPIEHKGSGMGKFRRTGDYFIYF